MIPMAFGGREWPGGFVIPAVATRELLYSARGYGGMTMRDVLEMDVAELRDVQLTKDAAPVRSAFLNAQAGRCISGVVHDVTEAPPWNCRFKWARSLVFG